MLYLLAEHPDGMGLSDIASSSGLGKSTAHMLISTLVEHGFADRLGGGTYRLGFGAFEVGLAVPDNARFGTLTEPMRELADQSGESVSLAVLRGLDAVIVQRFESKQILRAEIRVGTRMPLHSCASGKYLLAHMTDEEVDHLFPDKDLPAMTPASILSKRKLQSEFPQILATGFAINDEEYTEGVSGIATGVHDISRKNLVASVSIAGPISRFSPMDWKDELMRTAAAMANRLHRSNTRI